MSHGLWERLIPDPALRTGLSGGRGGVSVTRGLPVLVGDGAGMSVSPKWATEVKGKVWLQGRWERSALHFLPSESEVKSQGKRRVGLPVQSHWATSPPKPPLFQPQESSPSLLLKAFEMGFQSHAAGNILTHLRSHESKDRKCF